MKHEFNLILQIDEFLNSNFPNMSSSYKVKKHYGSVSASIFRLLKQVEHDLRSNPDLHIKEFYHE